MGAVEAVADGYNSRGVRVVRTEPSNGKNFSKLRTSMDDARRIQIIWSHVNSVIELLKPDVIGVEAYTVYEPKEGRLLKDAAQDILERVPLAPPPSAEGGVTTAPPVSVDISFTQLLKLREALAAQKGGPGLGQAAKTILVYGVVLGAAYKAGVPVFVFSPSDLKTTFGGSRGASKDDVGQGLIQLVRGLDAQLAEKVPQKTLREHAQDATGHAVLALRELQQYRIDTRQVT